MAKQNRSIPVMQAVLDAVAARLFENDESLIRIPDICEATGVNYGSVYHHFGSREGVIDAAYNQIFQQLVEDDIAIISQVSDEASSFEEFVFSMAPLTGMFSMGEERRQRRALRVRIVAAALTRPELRALISVSQERITAELERIVAYAQGRGWVRRDMDRRFIAALLQVMIFGRALDDISVSAVSDQDWDAGMALLFAELFNLPK